MRTLRIKHCHFTFCSEVVLSSNRWFVRFPFLLSCTYRSSVFLNKYFNTTVDF